MRMGAAMNGMHGSSLQAGALEAPLGCCGHILDGFQCEMEDLACAYEAGLVKMQHHGQGGINMPK